MHLTGKNNSQSKMAFRCMLRCLLNCATFHTKAGVSKNKFFKICWKQIFQKKKKKKIFIMTDSYFSWDTSYFLNEDIWTNLHYSASDENNYGVVNLLRNFNDTHREKLSFTRLSTRMVTWLLLIFSICLNN